MSFCSKQRNLLLEQGAIPLVLGDLIRMGKGEKLCGRTVQTSNFLIRSTEWTQAMGSYQSVDMSFVFGQQIAVLKRLLLNRALVLSQRILLVDENLQQGQDIVQYISMEKNSGARLTPINHLHR